MLLHQLLQSRAVGVTDRVGVGFHVRGIKLVPQSIRKPNAAPARRDLQGANDPANFAFAAGPAHRFFIFLLGGDNYKGNVPKVSQQPPDIQHPLLRAVGRRQGPVGCHKQDLWPTLRAI
jgi:hypothetical protein